MRFGAHRDRVRPRSSDRWSNGAMVSAPSGHVRPDGTRTQPPAAASWRPPYQTAMDSQHTPRSRGSPSTTPLSTRSCAAIGSTSPQPHESNFCPRGVLMIDEFAKEYLHGDLRYVREAMLWK